MATKPVSGALLPCGINREIEPAIVDGVDSIQQYVGGLFDSVTQVLPDGQVLVGYCHDEGLLLNLEINWYASALFLRELRGPVVIVSGKSPEGEYDGENYDLPNRTYAWLTSKFTEQVAQTYNESVVMSALIGAAVELDILSKDEAREFAELLDKAVETGDDYEVKEMLNEIQERLQEWALENAGAELSNEVEDFLRGKDLA